LHPAATDGLFRAAMHLRFTESELAILIEMVSLAANVAAVNQKPGAEEGVAAFEDLESKILERAGHAGFGDIIEFDDEKQQYRVTDEYEGGSFYQECFDEFREESFWEELVIRLADRDLIRSIGLRAWEKLNELERRARTSEIEKRYWDEFTKNGIDRVALIHPPSEG
jgi:hypothetical protein